MFGYNGYPQYNHYDPFPFFWMMNNMPRKDEINEIDELKMFKKYKDLFQEMKREFEPPKKDEPKKEKKEGEWTQNDYFTFIVCFVSSSVLIGGYFILHELVEFARIIHAH